jgi:hypothetical protein
VAKPYVRFKIPVGSTFEVKVSGDASLVSAAHYQPPSGNAESWDDGALRGGRRRKLNAAAATTRVT